MNLKHKNKSSAVLFLFCCVHVHVIQLCKDSDVYNYHVMLNDNMKGHVICVQKGPPPPQTTYLFILLHLQLFTVTVAQNRIQGQKYRDVHKWWKALITNHPKYLGWGDSIIKGQCDDTKHVLALTEYYVCDYINVEKIFSELVDGSFWPCTN